MIRVEPAKEPADFDEKVRKRGNEWLKTNSEGKKSPPAFWREVHEEFFAAYKGYCAYTTFRLPTSEHGVVDHFKPKSRYKELTYEWTNYRLAGYYVNSKKGESCEVLDPFQLPEDAYLLQADGSIEANAAVFTTPRQQEQAERTIDILGLNSPANCKARREYIRNFLESVSAQNTTPEVIACAKKALKSSSRFLYHEAQRQGMIPGSVEKSFIIE